MRYIKPVRFLILRKYSWLFAQANHINGKHVSSARVSSAAVLSIIVTKFLCKGISKKCEIRSLVWHCHWYSNDVKVRRQRVEYCTSLAYHYVTQSTL